MQVAEPLQQVQICEDRVQTLAAALLDVTLAQRSLLLAPRLQQHALGLRPTLPLLAFRVVARTRFDRARGGGDRPQHLGPAQPARVRRRTARTSS